MLVSRKFVILHITKQLIQRLKTNKCLKSEERLFKGQVGHEIHTGHKRSQQQLSHRPNMDYHKINAELSVATETKEILTYSFFSTDLNGDTKRTTGKRDTFGEERTAGPMEKYQGTPTHPPEKSKCLEKKEHELLPPRHRHRSSIAR